LFFHYAILPLIFFVHSTKFKRNMQSPVTSTL
jgi:hypothetical protein